MIRNNECGVFNPLLLECLSDVADQLPNEINDSRMSQLSDADFSKIARSIFESTDDSSDNIIYEQYLIERKKSQFFSSLQKGISFEYTYEPSVLKLNARSARALSFPRTMVEPENNSNFWNIFGRDNWDEFVKLLHDSQLNNDSFTFNSEMMVKGEKRPCKIRVQQSWNRRDPENPELICVYGNVEFF